MRYPLVFLLATMALALVVAMAIMITQLDPPAEDIRLFFTFMTVTGTISVLLAYLIYQQGMKRWFSSLRWALLSSILFAVLLMVPNVWITLQLMYISEHDLYMTVALLFFAAMTATGFGLYASNALVKRISDLSEAAGSLAGGKLDTRLEVTGKDELAAFARTFNWMAESLQQIDEDKRRVEQTRRDLIAGVSHDLRTPLTSMRAMMEAISDGVVDDRATILRYVEQSLHEIGSLSHLIDDLLQLAQLDAGRLDMRLVNTSMRDLISDVISGMSPRADREGVTLKSDIRPDIDPVYMAPDKIQRVLFNLLDNALRYTPSGGEVTLRAYREGEEVVVEVHNTGEAIDAVHLPHIFESFYRGEKSRSRAGKGHRSTGLGLAIARGLVEAHKGKIEVQSAAERGTTFRFALPRRGRMGVSAA